MKKLIILFIGAVINTGALGDVITFKAVANTKSPCNGEILTVHGMTTLSINETSKGVFVSENFTGVENGYSVNYNGKGEFNELQKMYEIEVTGEWKSGKENFKSNGTDKILTRNGIEPTGDKFQKTENECE
jgi:hypothetical protein